MSSKYYRIVMFSLVVNELNCYVEPDRIKILQSYFKTGGGEYGEGDIFVGVRMPYIRKIARKHIDLEYDDIKKLILNYIHEYRSLGLLILVYKARRKTVTEDERKQVFNFYMKHIEYVNNWDLVDITCKNIVGDYLLDKNKDVLYELAKSRSIWKKRIAIISTHQFIKKDIFTNSLKISKQLLKNQHDLINKAVGWTLREVGKKDKDVLCRFLDENIHVMNRITLNYSTELFSKKERNYYVQMKTKT